MNSDSNGTHLALAALGILAAASIAKNRRLPVVGSSSRHSSGSCSRCGTHMEGSLAEPHAHSHFMEGSMAVAQAQSQFDNAPPDWASGTLFWSRATDQSGWICPYSTTVEINKAFRRVKKESAERFDSLVNASGPGIIRALQAYSQAVGGAADSWLKQPAQQAIIKRGERAQQKKLDGLKAKLKALRSTKGIPRDQKKKQVSALVIKRDLAERKLRDVKKIGREKAKVMKKERQLTVIANGNGIFENTLLGKAAFRQQDRLRSRYGLFARDEETQGVRDMMTLIFYGEYKVNNSGQWIAPVLGSTKANAATKFEARQLAGFKLKKGQKLSGMKYIGDRKGVQGSASSMASLKHNYVVRAVKYMRMLYTKRAWCQHVLGKMQKKGVAGWKRSGRRGVVDQPGVAALWSGVAFKLAVADDPGLITPSLTAVDGVSFESIRGDVVVQGDLDEDTVDADDEANDDEMPTPLVVGSPTLRFYKGKQRQSMWWVTKNGTLQFERGRSDVPLLTETSKMASPSFSLPAYTTQTGGTCPAANVADTRVRALAGLRRGQTVICETCYALTAGYAYANVMTDAAARMAWVKGKENNPKQLGALMALMISSYAKYGRKGSRADQEIGIWNSDQGKLLRYGSRKMMPTKPVKLRIATYDGARLAASTTDLFKTAPDGSLAGFFRLHDSGDLFSPNYIRAWTFAARMMPFVYIWIPTRVWAKTGYLNSSNLPPQAKAWWTAWMDGELKGSRPWTLRKGSLSRRGSRSLLDETPTTVAQSSPGEIGLKDWFLDDDCEKAVLPDYFSGRNGQYRMTKRYRALQELASLPNLALRPSGLYIKEYPDDPVTIPTLPGLSAGSGVCRKYSPAAFGKLKALRQAVESRRSAKASDRSEARAQQVAMQQAFRVEEKIRKKASLKYPQLSSMQIDSTPAQEAYQCPVYTENAQGVEAKSCRTANCRACWILPELPIFYGAH